MPPFISTDPPWTGLAAPGAVFPTQFTFTKRRQHFRWMEEVVDNSPLMLMYEGRILDRNLPIAGVTRSDIIGKLREANALDLSSVQAVVLEPSDDISVLHGESSAPEILESVSWGWEEIPDELCGTSSWI